MNTTTFTARLARLPQPAGLTLAVLLAISGAALAQDTETFEVTATVEESCTMGAIPALGFGVYDANAALVPNDAVTTIEVSCSLGTDFTIALDGGTVTGISTAREMASGTNRLPYGLFQDATRLIPWGEGTDAQSGTGLGLLELIPLTVHGRIPAEQNVPPGAYSDTVTATLTVP